MVIEALISGEVMTSEEIPPEALIDIPGANWEENAKAREEIVKTFCLKFEDKLKRFFNKDLPLEFRLVASSKMTDE